MTTSSATDKAASLDIRAIYERYVSTFATRNLAEIVKLHSEDSKFWYHGGMPAVVGREAIAEVFGGVFEQWPEAGFDVYRTLFIDRHWILDWAMTAVLTRKNGERVAVKFDALDVVEVDDEGLVVRKDTFVDAEQVKAARKAAQA